MNWIRNASLSTKMSETTFKDSTKQFNDYQKFAVVKGILWLSRSRERSLCLYCCSPACDQPASDEHASYWRWCGKFSLQFHRHCVPAHAYWLAQQTTSYQRQFTSLWTSVFYIHTSLFVRKFWSHEYRNYTNNIYAKIKSSNKLKSVVSGISSVL